MSDTRTVFDPFELKSIEISNRLVDRLRGKYASGPHLPNGNPEFGWRQFQAPPIQHEAAAEIEKLRAERDALKLKVERLVKALRPFSEYANCKCTCCNHDADVIAGPVTNDLNFTREITVGDLREADAAIKEAGK